MTTKIRVHTTTSVHPNRTDAVNLVAQLVLKQLLQTEKSDSGR